MTTLQTTTKTPPVRQLNRHSLTFADKPANTTANTSTFAYLINTPTIITNHTMAGLLIHRLRRKKIYKTMTIDSINMPSVRCTFVLRWFTVVSPNKSRTLSARKKPKGEDKENPKTRNSLCIILIPITVHTRSLLFANSYRMKYLIIYDRQILGILYLNRTVILTKYDRWRL